jgi:hypothetical protein
MNAYVDMKVAPVMDASPIPVNFGLCPRRKGFAGLQPHAFNFKMAFDPKEEVFEIRGRCCFCDIEINAKGYSWQDISALRIPTLVIQEAVERAGKIKKNFGWRELQAKNK